MRPTSANRLRGKKPEPYDKVAYLGEALGDLKALPRPNRALRFLGFRVQLVVLSPASLPAPNPAG